MVIGFPFSSEIYILSYKNDKKQIITQKDKNNTKNGHEVSLLRKTEEGCNYMLIRLQINN